MDKIDLVRQYAKAWNNLNIKYIEPYLDEDFHYESQLVFNAITSKDEYLKYLNCKFEIIKKSNDEGDSFLNAEIGIYQKDPCLILLQIHNEPKLTGSLTKFIMNGNEEWVNVTSKAIETVLLIKCKEDKLIRGDMCIVPTALEVQRTGEMPT
ncbi:MAG: hypothetical protein ACOYN6_16150 [Ignavibacteria bacterium]